MKPFGSAIGRTPSGGKQPTLLVLKAVYAVGLESGEDWTSSLQTFHASSGPQEIAALLANKTIRK